MNAALIPDERNCNENEDHDQHDPLFVFRELENPEQALHFIVACMSYASCHVEQSAATKCEA